QRPLPESTATNTGQLPPEVVEGVSLDHGGSNGGNTPGGEQVAATQDKAKGLTRLHSDLGSVVGEEEKGNSSSNRRSSLVHQVASVRGRDNESRGVRIGQEVKQDGIFHPFQHSAPPPPPPPPPLQDEVQGDSGTTHNGAPARLGRARVREDDLGTERRRRETRAELISVPSSTPSEAAPVSARAAAASCGLGDNSGRICGVRDGGERR
ncbi:unnamed protein product, partial [Sphacelaria rigidula]